MNDLLIEIGTEELPARFIENSKEAFKSLIEESLIARRISFEKIEVFGTPRRIVAYVTNLSGKQEEILTLKYGPPTDIAYDQTGNPLKPAIGFAKSQGVSVDELIRVERDGIEVVAYEKKEGGRKTEEILPEILKETIQKIPFPKRMRWGYETFEFARPIKWLLVLYGEKVIHVKIADVISGNVSFGHRFLKQGPILINNPREYFSKLKDAYVIVDDKERKRLIVDGINRIERESNAKALYDESLLNEILYITEYPYGLKGKFHNSYLKLPVPVLINVMRSHQRYIPLGHEDGTLEPSFIFFANTLPKDERVIIRGNEKVLKARLDDASFYFEEDKKIDLFSLYEKLASLMYHEKIGTMKEKVERVEKIADYVARVLDIQQPDKVKRASKLLKVDLLTHMVGEFPELQGKMGRIYAELKGEDKEVSSAIEEHYYPTSTEGKLPETRLGTIMSISDKIDTLVSFFSCGISPTGNLDPYGLRRCAIGLVRILVEKGINLSLQELISIGYKEGEKIRNRLPLDDVKYELTDFVVTRFKYLMIDRGYDQDLVESVIPWASLDLYDAYMRLLTLNEIRSVPDFEKLIVGFKRVFNITKKMEGTYEVKKELFQKKEEEILHSVYEIKKDPYLLLMKERRYRDALSSLIEFKDPIDRFFEKVYVMVEEESVRNNRLALLKNIKDMFLLFCDFQKIKSD
jgi:glycyl-tRNA synthetase beta chain